MSVWDPEANSAKTAEIRADAVLVSDTHRAVEWHKNERERESLHQSHHPPTRAGTVCLECFPVPTRPRRPALELAQEAVREAEATLAWVQGTEVLAAPADDASLFDHVATLGQLRDLIADLPDDTPMPAVALEDLEKRFNTVAAFWHDAYCQWQVKVDHQRRTFDDCRYEGWGDTIAEASRAAAQAAEQPDATAPKP